ncbi:hypothetical protein Bca4012_098304 [Brassica carinata]
MVSEQHLFVVEDGNRNRASVGGNLKEQNKVKIVIHPMFHFDWRKGDSTVLRWCSSTERRVSPWLLSMKEIGVLCIGYSRRRRKPATSLSLWLPETKPVGDMSIRRLSETKESGEISLMVALGVFRKTVNGDISLLVALGDEGTRWLSMCRSMERWIDQEARDGVIKRQE